MRQADAGPAPLRCAVGLSSARQRQLRPPRLHSGAPQRPHWLLAPLISHPDGPFTLAMSAVQVPTMAATMATAGLCDPRASLCLSRPLLNGPLGLARPHPGLHSQWGPRRHQRNPSGTVHWAPCACHVVCVTTLGGGVVAKIVPILKMMQLKCCGDLPGSLRQEAAEPGSNSSISDPKLALPPLPTAPAPAG